jgi:hypothetical protein
MPDHAGPSGSSEERGVDMCQWDERQATLTISLHSQSVSVTILTLRTVEYWGCELDATVSAYNLMIGFYGDSINISVP